MGVIYLTLIILTFFHRVKMSGLLLNQFFFTKEKAGQWGPGGRTRDRLMVRGDTLAA